MCIQFQLFKGNAFGETRSSKCVALFVNIILTPFLLIYWSIVIFVLPCLFNCLGKCCWKVLLRWEPLKSCLAFRDREFQCNDENAGGKNIQWLRLQNISCLNSKTASRLFDNIEPADIAQGQLGDCWLLAALATLSERPELIQNAFATLSFNPRGKYIIRLYDSQTKSFKRFAIDDYIPCNSTTGKPIYTNLLSNEMWPLLLEKAFAKMHGGYGKLNGGLPLDAMKAITGYAGDRMILSQKSDAKVFDQLKRYYESGCILACGTKGQDKTRQEGRESVKGSIVGGHAYSILGIYEPMLTTSKVRLLKLRNPWGSFEWKGEWSDSSSNWTTYPGVALEIGKPKEANDGIFYIAWEDFLNYYDLVDILFPSVSIADTHISLHEEWGALGSVIGCTAGLVKFWCLCQGCFRLWFPKASNVVKPEYV